MAVAVLALVCLLMPLSQTVPLEKAAPAVPETEGETILIRTVEELQRVLKGEPRRKTLLIADGIYTLEAPARMDKGGDVVIRSASGDPARAVLRGMGFFAGKPGDDLLQLGHVENVTIADLTFEECRSYGVKIEAERFPKNVHIRNCRFKNIGIRMIKGSSSREGRAVGGSIRYCRFENTLIPPADWLYEGDYISAIDMMSLEGWTIADNLFLNIKGRKGGARGAIFIWVRSNNVIVERNAILGCDRGVSFGNPSGSTNFVEGQEHIRDSVIRNNVIVPGPDAGIELWWARNIGVYNNTVWREDAAGPGLRGGMSEWKIEGIRVVNNLVRGTNMLDGDVFQESNLFGDLAGCSLDWSRLAFLCGPEVAGMQGKSLEEVQDDFNGKRRGRTPHIGAFERAEGP